MPGRKSSSGTPSYLLLDQHTQDEINAWCQADVGRTETS